MDKNFFGGFDAPGFDITPTAPSPTPYAAQTQKPVQTRGRGGTLTSLISEGGALGGALTGAAIGSGVPVIGTAIGGVIGAGLGAFGGRLAENKIRDDRFDRLGVTEALKEGAISAVLSGPLKIGKYGATAAKGLIAKKGAEEALKGAAKAATEFTLRGQFAKGGEKVVETAITKQFKLPANFLSKFKGRFGVTAPQVLNQYGINNIDDVVTKGINPLQSSFDDLVKQSPRLNKNQVATALKNIYEPYIKSPVLEFQTLGKAVKDQADELVKFVGKGGIDPSDLNILKAKFDVLSKQTIAKTPQNNLAKKVADGLRKLLQDNADNAGLSTNGAKLSDIGIELNKLRYLDDALKSKEFVGAGASPVSLTGLLGATAGSTVGGVPGALIGYATVAGLNSPAGRAISRAFLNKTTQKLASSAAKATTEAGAIKGAVKGALRPELLKAAYNLATAEPKTVDEVLAQSSPSYLQGAGTTATTRSGMIGVGAGGQIIPTDTTATTTNPFTPELLITAIASDPKNAGIYQSLYKVYEDKYKAATPKKLTEAQQAREDIISLANQAKTQLATGKIKTGLLAGNFEQLKAIVGKADQATLDFNTTVSALLGTIAKARGGTSFTAEERKLLEKYAPKVGDSRQQLETKIDALVKQFGQPTNVTSLEELLLAQSGGIQ